MQDVTVICCLHSLPLHCAIGNLNQRRSQSWWSDLDLKIICIESSQEISAKHHTSGALAVLLCTDHKFLNNLKKIVSFHLQQTQQAYTVYPYQVTDVQICHAQMLRYYSQIFLDLSSELTENIICLKKAQNWAEYKLYMVIYVKQNLKFLIFYDKRALRSMIFLDKVEDTDSRSFSTVIPVCISSYVLGFRSHLTENTFCLYYRNQIRKCTQVFLYCVLVIVRSGPKSKSR